MVDELLCKQCNYKTDRLNNYRRHIKSKKHIKHSTGISANTLLETEEGTKIKCIHCDKEMHKANKARHYKVCKKSNQNANEKLIASLEKKIETMKSQIQELEERNLELDKQFKTYILYSHMTS